MHAAAAAGRRHILAHETMMHLSFEEVAAI